MCLNDQLSLKTINIIKKDIDKKGIKVYKVVGVRDGKYYTLYKKEPGGHGVYEKGLNHADTEKTLNQHCGTSEYKAGFHFFADKGDAERFLSMVRNANKRDSLNWSIFPGQHVLITCTVKKTWITTIGTESTSGAKSRIIVAKKAIFPKFKN